MRLIIPNHQCPSWNGTYAGQHWAKRSAMANTLHWLTRAAIPAEAEAFTGPVAVTVTAYRDRLIDPDNVPAKMYIDGLKGRLLDDDTPQYVRSVTTRCLKCNGDKPRVEIDITEITE